MLETDIVEITRTCKKCGRIKPLSKFKNGNGYVCKNCGKSKNKQNKVKWIQSFKGSGCQLCGYNAHPTAIEFHHVNAEDKDRDLSLMKSMGYQNIVDEISKCLIVCANCHREIHANLVSEKKIQGAYQKQKNNITGQTFLFFIPPQNKKDL